MRNENFEGDKLRCSRFAPLQKKCRIKRKSRESRRGRGVSRSTSWRVTRGYDAMEGGGGFWSGMGWLGLGEQADKKEVRKRRGFNSRVSSVVEICSGQRPGSLETDKGAPLGNGREPGQREGRAGQSGHWASRARRREKKTQGRRRLGKLVRAGPGRKRTGARGPKPKGFHDPSGPKRNGTGRSLVGPPSSEITTRQTAQPHTPVPR